MSFHLKNVLLENVMVCGVRTGTSKSNRQYLSLTVVDGGGFTNELSTSEPSTIEYCLTLRQGDKVNVRVMAHGDRQRQYLMIDNVEDSVVLLDPVPTTSVGY